MRPTTHGRTWAANQMQHSAGASFEPRWVGSSLRGVAPMLASSHWGKPIREDVCIGGPPFIMLTHAGESEASIWQSYGVHASAVGISPSAADRARAASVQCCNRESITFTVKGKSRTMDEEDDAPDRRTQQYGIRGIRYPHIAYVATDTCTSTVRRLGALVRVDRPAAFLGFAARLEARFCLA